MYTSGSAAADVGTCRPRCRPGLPAGTPRLARRLLLTHEASHDRQALERHPRRPDPVVVVHRCEDGNGSEWRYRKLIASAQYQVHIPRNSAGDEDSLAAERSPGSTAAEIRRRESWLVRFRACRLFKDNLAVFGVDLTFAVLKRVEHVGDNDQKCHWSNMLHDVEHGRRFKHGHARFATKARLLQRTIMRPYC